MTWYVCIPACYLDNSELDEFGSETDQLVWVDVRVFSSLVPVQRGNGQPLSLLLLLQTLLLPNTLPQTPSIHSLPSFSSFNYSLLPLLPPPPPPSSLLPPPSSLPDSVPPSPPVPEGQQRGLVHHDCIPPRTVILVRDNVVLLHILYDFVRTKCRVILLRESEIILQERERERGGRGKGRERGGGRGKGGKGREREGEEREREGEGEREREGERGGREGKEGKGGREGEREEGRVRRRREMIEKEKSYSIIANI